MCFCAECLTVADRQQLIREDAHFVSLSASALGLCCGGGGRLGPAAPNNATVCPRQDGLTSIAEDLVRSVGGKGSVYVCV